MEIKAKTKYVRLSPTKARTLARNIQGLKVEEALRVVELNKNKAAVCIGKTLKSAIANAENNKELSSDRLYVQEAIIEKGPVMRRFWPRSRGMVSPVEKKMSHIRITLTDKKPAAN